MAIEFGPKPYRIKVRVGPPGTRVYQTVRAPEGQPAWPDDVTISLRFNLRTGDVIVWNAEIDPDDDHLLVWDRDPDQVDELRDVLTQVASVYWFGGEDFWGKGPVDDVS